MAFSIATKFKKYGLIAAGISNILGVIICSRFFTNSTINETDPVVMSNFGLLMIVIWGLAYIVTSTITSNIKWLVGVFAIEKLIYFIMWVMWLSNNNLGSIYSNDFFAGIFYSIYGMNDLIFMLFFVVVFVSENERIN